MEIEIFKTKNGFSVLMYDKAFWDGNGYACRFDCVQDELQDGIKKALSLYGKK